MVAAGVAGLSVGLVNRWLVSGPVHRLRQVRDPASPEARAAMRQVAGRFLLRMVLSLALLFAVFLVHREPPALLAAVVGLVLPNAWSVVTAARQRRTS